MSPGGTTEAAFDSLIENKLDKIWEEAIASAKQRSIELGDQED
jgi:pyrroline-5-carboxylate reductase